MELLWDQSTLNRGHILTTLGIDQSFSFNDLRDKGLNSP